MLFNSFEFIFGFLPAVLAAFFLLKRAVSFEAALVFLVLASLFFYGWWKPVLVLLIVASIVVNIGFGRYLSADGAAPGRRKAALVLGIAFNLGLLGYFKYAGFLAANLNALFGSGLAPGAIVLPIAISFFTFQQIAYLVDAYRNLVREFSVVRYFLFVTFFPQLIAGPIVHHGEMMPQFAALRDRRFDAGDFAMGLTIFAIGLFKKVVLADVSGHFADPIFAAAAGGTVLSIAEAWVGALGFSFQIYFDFSGYSDMAIGIARMFGIVLPLNFHSPYKATSIIDFWRRWHMTLSRFLRDYLYIPLGGNRHGVPRRHVNLMVVMVLGGLWHGAAWTFVLWGALHGAFLVINHLWRRLAARGGGGLGNGLSRTLTFVAVAFAWVVFRAPDLATAIGMMKSMAGLNGISLGRSSAAWFGEYVPALNAIGIRFDGLFGDGIVPDRDFVVLWFVPLMIIVMKAPSTYDLFAGSATAPADGPQPGSILPGRWAWNGSLGWSMAAGLMIFLSLQQFFQVTPFLYFQF